MCMGFIKQWLVNILKSARTMRTELRPLNASCFWSVPFVKILSSCFKLILSCLMGIHFFIPFNKTADFTHQHTSATIPCINLGKAGNCCHWKHMFCIIKEKMITTDDQRLDFMKCDGMILSWCFVGNLLFNGRCQRWSPERNKECLQLSATSSWCISKLGSLR